MTPIQKYFLGEKLQCSVGIGIALTCLAIGVYLLLQVKADFSRGIAYPFLIVPLLLLIVCIGVVFRTSSDIARVTGFAESEPVKIQTEEIPRMKAVMRNFKMIKVVEVCILAIGAGIFLFAKEHPFTRGIGVGLAVQAIIMLCFDVLAENRGKIYWEYLKGLT